MKTIDFTVTDSRGTTSIREQFDEDASWHALAYMFHKFLAAQGYFLQPEDVGACVESYVNSGVESEDLW